MKSEGEPGAAGSRWWPGTAPVCCAALSPASMVLHHQPHGTRPACPGVEFGLTQNRKKSGPTMGHTLKSPISPVTKSVLCLQSISLQRLFSVKVFEIGHFPLCKLKRELPSPPFVYQICLWLLHLDSPASDSHVLPPRRVFVCQTLFLLSQYRLSETILVWLPSGVWVIITEKYPLALNTHCLMAQLSIRSFAINWMGNVI